MPIIGSSGAPLRTNPPPMEYQTCSSTKLAAASDVHHVVGIHGGRQIAFEPSHRSTIGAVAETGQRQRTIKRDFDTCGAIDQMVGLQRGGESMCRDHRAYGVRG